MSDSPYSVPVPEHLVETIEYNLRDTLGTAVLDLIAKHPSTTARDALVAAVRLVNPSAVVTDDGIEVAPDDCYVDGIAYPEHAYTMSDGTICERCGAESDREVSRLLPDDVDDFGIGSLWVDANGAKIPHGASVRQANVYDPARGALYANVNVDGVVTGFARTRVLVDFGRESRGGKIIDRVAPDLLVVQTHEL